MVNQTLVAKRYTKGIQAIQLNKDTSPYVQHILKYGHSYSNIDNTMEIIQIEKNSHF
jgi:hypothetical protein